MSNHGLTVNLKVHLIAGMEHASNVQAGTGGAGPDQPKSISQKRQKMESKNVILKLGHGARVKDMEMKKVARLRARGVAMGLAALAKRCALARARKLEALENRPVEVSTVSEIEGIYRAEFVRAWAGCGQVVNLRKLYLRRKRGGVNPYPFQARLAWIRALRTAMSQSRSEIYRSHKLADETASMADLMRLRDEIGGTGARGQGIEATAFEAVADGSRGGWMSSSRIVRHARECLIVHWTLAGGQRWQSALAADLAMMRDCLRVARGEGHEVFLTEFFDCVVIDEGVRLKATESLISLGVRTLRPQFRLVLTGTPVKNILDDIFWLAHWACGGHSDPTPRWPYEDSDKAKERFANDHLLLERNISREEEYKARTGKNRTTKKRTPRICNIHRLWKLFGPVIIRRRKDDCGEDIVAKRFVPMRIRPGTAQQAVYQRYVANKPVASKTGEPVKGTTRAAMQLQLLREAALCPDSLHLSQANVCGDGPKRSWTDLTPKSIAMLKLVGDLLQVGQQLTIMSSFQHFSRTFSARLTEAGVSHAVLDGSVPPEKRGEIAAEFKARKFAVLIGGIESMSEGHSFDQCSHLILPSLVWAMDKNLQAIDRVHRLTSREDVTIYTFATENTVDVLLESRFQEKKDSAQLALDGRLFADDHKEINLTELLADAITNFNPDAPTFNEKDMETEWDATLRNRLRHAETAWREWHPPIIPGHNLTSADIEMESAAIAAIETISPIGPISPISPRAAIALSRLQNL